MSLWRLRVGLTALAQQAPHGPSATLRPESLLRKRRSPQETRVQAHSQRLPRRACAHTHPERHLCPVPAAASPLSCSMKHTFPLVLKARVSGVMHRLWKMAAWATLRMDRLHSRHTAHASCSLKPRSRRERMSARDTFSCQDRPWS